MSVSDSGQVTPAAPGGNLDWRDLMATCRYPAADAAVARWEPFTSQLAEHTGAAPLTAERELRLHLPSAPRSALDLKEVPLAIATVLRSRLSSFGKDYLAYSIRAREDQLPTDGELLCSQGALVVRSRSNPALRVPVKFASVAVRDAQWIETKLHYLRSYRQRAIARWGLFVEGAVAPFAYVAFAQCDRAYFPEALHERCGLSFPEASVAHMARAYGVRLNPKNAFSKLLSLCAGELFTRGATVITTAVNPFLGFDGQSLHAAGFSQLALCPVTYQYDLAGNFITRRQGAGRPSSWCTVPNVLLARGIRRFVRRRLAMVGTLVAVSPILHILSMYDLNIRTLTGDSALRYEGLRQVRNLLEGAWSEKTRYRATPFRISDPVSKGQCGVTSAYLARRLAGHGLDVMFCQGNVYFSDGTPPILDHCWLALTSQSLEKAPDEVIMDLTADQTGYPEPVVCASRAELTTLKILYVETSRIAPGAVDVASLRKRLEHLEREVQAATRMLADNTSEDASSDV